jgi:hypothetical protein
LRKLVASLLLVISCGTIASSQTVTTVVASNGSSALLRDFTGNPLSQGSPTLNHDGMLIQLGYYSSASISNNFGTGIDWIPLTSATPSNTSQRTTIGDSFNLTGAGDGRLSFTQIIFQTGTSTVDIFDPSDSGHYTSTSLLPTTLVTPPASQVLSIRFFDTQTGTSGRYNAVSADNWLWKTPDSTGAQTVFINIDISSSVLEWQDPGNAFKTSIPLAAIPEPTTIGAGLLCAASLVCSAAWRRRKAS